MYRIGTPALNPHGRQDGSWGPYSHSQRKGSDFHPTPLHVHSPHHLTKFYNENNTVTTSLECATEGRRFDWRWPSASHCCRVSRSSRISTAARSQGPGPSKVCGVAGGGGGASAIGRVARSRLLASSVASAASTRASHCPIPSNMRRGWAAAAAERPRREESKLDTYRLGMLGESWGLGVACPWAPMAASTCAARWWLAHPRGGWGFRLSD